MEDLTPEQKFHAEEAAITVPRDLISGKPRTEILEGLIRLDYTAEDAEKFICKIEEKILIVKNKPEQIEALKNESKKAYAIGLPLVLLSIVIFIMMNFIAGIVILAIGLGFLMKADGDISSLKEIQKILNEQKDLTENSDKSKH